MISEIGLTSVNYVRCECDECDVCEREREGLSGLILFSLITLKSYITILE